MADSLLPKSTEISKTPLYTEVDPRLVELALDAIPRPKWKRTKNNAVSLGLFLLATLPKDELMKYLDAEQEVKAGTTQKKKK